MFKIAPRNRGRSLEGPCQEGKAIFFIFFCKITCNYLAAAGRRKGTDRPFL
jgi:hypothetical protein